MILVFALFSFPAAAQTAANLNGGGFVEADRDSLFVAEKDGIYRVDGAQSERIFEGRASMLQFFDGKLYFISETYEIDEFGDAEKTFETPACILPDGSGLTFLGEPRPFQPFSDYDDSDADAARVDRRVGYAGFTVKDGSVFYLANSGIGGEYECRFRWYGEDGSEETETRRVRFEDGIALYRMDTDGRNPVRLTEPIGNSVAHMSVSDGRIYLAGGWQDVIYAYSFVNYLILDTDGNELLRFENPDAELPFTSDAGRFYHIPEAVLPFGDDMLVSLSESEGDFIASQLFRLTAEGEMSLIALEQYFVPSVLENRTLYYVGSNSDTIYADASADYAASLGIYRKDITETGVGAKLTFLPDGEYMYRFNLNVLDGTVFFRGTDARVHRLDASGNVTDAVARK